MALVVGIDASRNRSGGARVYLRNLLERFDPSIGVKRVHVWSYRALLDQLPEMPWLVKHNPAELEASLFTQLWWQARRLAGEVRRRGCDILFVADASTAGGYEPMVVFSQDLLSYEPGIMRHYAWSRAWLRLWAILHLQNRAFRAAAGVIFLTRYSRATIERSCGSLRRAVCVPHGVDEIFRGIVRARPWPRVGEREIECLYISNMAMYKNQWNVIRAIGRLRKKGYRLKLVLIGGGSGPARNATNEARREADPRNEFVEMMEYLPHGCLPGRLASADLFIFASACEAFGITLLEAMAAGLPIACSNRSGLPDLVADAGVLFDPESPEDIAAAVERIIVEPALRERLSIRAREVAARYSWSRCARETWSFIVDVANDYKVPNV